MNPHPPESEPSTEDKTEPELKPEPSGKRSHSKGPIKPRSIIDSLPSVLSSPQTGLPHKSMTEIRRQAITMSRHGLGSETLPSPAKPSPVKKGPGKPVAKSLPKP